MENSLMLVPNQQELDVYMVMAKRAAESKFYQQMGGEAGVIAIMLYARELGVSPMLAISGGFHNIQGKVEMSARLMNMMIRRAGHSLNIQHPDENTCKIHGKRADTGEEYTASYTFKEAQDAGIAKPGGGWFKHREDMLFARAISRLARRLFPDVIGTAYVEGEISDTLPMKNANPVRSKLNIVDIKPGKAEAHVEVSEPIVQTSTYLDHQIEKLAETADRINHDIIVNAVVEEMGGVIEEPKPKKKKAQRSAQEAFDAFKDYCINKQKWNSVLVKEIVEELMIENWGGTDPTTIPETLWTTFENWLKDILPTVKRGVEEADELGGRE